MNKAGRKSGGNRWKQTPWARLLANVDQNGPMWDGGTRCWLWLDSSQKSGYGHIYFDGRQQRAHRAAWEMVNGTIPDGLEIDHLCRNPRCVNPLHLEVVTHRENILRGNNLAAQRARQTHCKRGHEFTPENTRISKRGERVCRACHREYERARRAERFREVVGDRG